MGFDLGGLVGGIVGTAFGGPIGGMIGSEIGEAIEGQGNGGGGEGCGGGYGGCGDAAQDVANARHEHHEARHDFREAGHEFREAGHDRSEAQYHRDRAADDFSQGNIFGGDQMSDWTVMGRNRFTFDNPQPALYDRIAAVKAVAGDVPVEGRIVFTRRGCFPKGLPKWTLMLDALRAEFPAADFESPADTMARFGGGWQSLRSTVKPSNMADMR